MFLVNLPCAGVRDPIGEGILPSFCVCFSFSGKPVWLEGDWGRMIEQRCVCECRGAVHMMVGRLTRHAFPGLSDAGGCVQARCSVPRFVIIFLQGFRILNFLPCFSNYANILDSLKMITETMKYFFLEVYQPYLNVQDSPLTVPSQRL